MPQGNKQSERRPPGISAVGYNQYYSRGDWGPHRTGMSTGAALFLALARAGAPVWDLKGLWQIPVAHGILSPSPTVPTSLFGPQQQI